MADSRRADRVAEAIRMEVATFLAVEAKDPRITGFVTVTSVDVTRDLRHARVFVSVMGSDQERAATFDGLASLDWDASAEPMVLVRDPASGQVLGFGREGALNFDPGTGAGALELHFSNGVSSRSLTRRRP